MSICTSCGHEIAPDAVSFVENGTLRCWLCRELQTAICPYCSNPLPAKCQACPSCSLARQPVKGRSVTYFERVAMDELRTSGLSAAAIFGAITARPWTTPNAGGEKLEEWRVAFLQAVSPGRGRGPANAEKVVVDALLRLGRARDFQDAFIAARAVWALGHDYRPLMREFHRSLLLSWQRSGVATEVEISGTPDSCRACKRLRRARRVWTITDALKELPLPCPDCDNDIDDQSDEEEEGEPGFLDRTQPEESGPFREITLGWCRCDFSPILKSKS